MANNGYDQTYEDDRKENEETADLIPRAGRMLKEKLNEDLTGGAYVGSCLNMPSNTRLGKMSASDTALLNKYDKSPEGMKAKIKRTYGMKSGGSVKSPTMSFQTYTKTGKEAGMKTVPVKMSKGGSASARADGCAVKGKTRGKMC